MNGCVRAFEQLKFNHQIIVEHFVVFIPDMGMFSEVGWWFYNSLLNFGWKISVCMQVVGGVPCGRGNIAFYKGYQGEKKKKKIHAKCMQKSHPTHIPFEFAFASHWKLASQASVLPPFSAPLYSIQQIPFCDDVPERLYWHDWIAQVQCPSSFYFKRTNTYDWSARQTGGVSQTKIQDL